jgi:hypothetical protein
MTRQRMLAAVQIAGTVFFGVLGVVLLTQHHPRRAIAALILAGLGPVSYVVVRAAGRKETGATQHLMVSGDAQDLIDRAMTPLATAFPGADIERVASDTIVIHTPRSWKSFGEVLTVSFGAHGGDSEIALSSRCVRRQQLIDYGKNRFNVGQAVAALSSIGANDPLQ